MNSDDFSSFLVILIFALIINWIILREIISSGSRSAKLHLEAIKQTMILAAIAKKLEVDENLLNGVTKLDSYDKLRKFTANNSPVVTSASYEQGEKIGAAISRISGKKIT